MRACVFLKRKNAYYLWAGNWRGRSNDGRDQARLVVTGWQGCS